MTLTYMRHEVDRTLFHQYTRIPRIPVVDNPGTPDEDESRNSWNQTEYVDGTPVLLQPCLYQQQTQVDVEGRGLQVIDRPVFLVPITDPLAPGDKVSHVVDANTGLVVLEGPVPVDDVKLFPDAPIYHQALLRTTKEV